MKFLVTYSSPSDLLKERLLHYPHHYEAPEPKQKDVINPQEIMAKVEELRSEKRKIFEWIAKKRVKKKKKKQPNNNELLDERDKRVSTTSTTSTLSLQEEPGYTSRYSRYHSGDQP